MGGRAHAVTYTWSGNSTVNWGTVDGFNAVPTSAAATALVFGADGTAGTANGHVLNDNIAALTIGSITFNAGAPSYTFGGTGVLTVGATGTFLTNNSGALQTINTQINGGNFASTIAGNGDIRVGGLFAFGGTQTLTVNNTGVTTFGNIDINDTNNNGRTATFAGSGATRITGIIANGTGATSVNNSIAYAGTGSLTLSGTSTYTGTTTAAQGMLIAGGNAQGTGTGVFGNSTSGGILLGSTTLTGSASLVTNGAYTIARSIAEVTANGGATLPTNSSLTIGGIQTSGTSSFTNSISLKINTTLTSAAGGEVDFTTGVISGTVNVAIDGGGLIKLTGANTFGSATAHANTVTIQGGTTLNLTSAGTTLGAAGNDLVFNNGTLQFGAVFDPSAARTMTFNSGGATFDPAGTTETFANPVGNAGTGALRLNNSTGTGVLVLSAANTYTGGNTVNAGTLQVSGAGTLGGTGGTLTVNTGGTLDLNGTNQSVGNFTGSGGTVTNTGAGAGTASTLNIGVGNGTGGSYAGVVADGAGTVALTKMGTGTITLTGAQAYTGATTVSNGTLTLGTGGSLAGTAVTVSGGTLQVGANGSTAATTLGTSGAASLTIGGASVGTVSLQNNALNSLLINSSAAGSTALSFNGGMVSLDIGGATTNDSDVITLGSGLGTNLAGSNIINLNVIGTGLNGNTQQLIAWNSLPSGAGSFSLGTITGVGQGAYSLSLSVTATGLYLLETTSSTAFWKGPGTSWATLSNFTTDQAGTTVRTAALDANTAVTFIANGGTNFANTTLDQNTTIGSLAFNVGGVGIGSGVGGPFALTIASTGNAVTVAGGVGAGTETISSNVALGANQSWTVTDAASTLLVSGNVSGAGFNLIKAGAGTLAFSGTNTYSGTTTVAGGALNLRSSGALGGTSGVTVSTGGTLQLQGGITVAPALTLSGTGPGTAGALENVSGNNAYTGLVTLGAAASIGSDAGLLSLSNPGTIMGASFGLTLTGGGNGLLASGVGTGAGSLSKTGAGVWTLSGANTYTGGTSALGGTLALSGAGTLGSVNGALTVMGGTLDLGGTSQGVGSLTGTGGTITNNGAAGTLTVGNGNAGGNFAGVLGNGTGAVSLVKTGTGVFTLAGTNGYTGATTVSGGALNVASNGALGSGGSNTSGVSVAGGAALQLTGAGVTTPGAVGVTLNGAGLTAGPNGALESVTGTNVFAGAVTLGSDATIGADTGTLTLNSVTAVAGGNHNLTLTGAGNVTVGSVIDATTASVSKNGTGTLTLTGNNGYTGATNLNAGTLVYGTVNALASSQFLNLGSGTNNVSLTYGGAGGTLATQLVLTGTTGTVTLGNTGTGAINYTNGGGTLGFGSGGAKTLVLGNATDTVGGTISGVIDNDTFNGPISLTKNGLSNSTWVVTGTNAYSGPTTISGGVLQSNYLNNTTVGTSSTLTMLGTANTIAIFQSNDTALGNALSNGTHNVGTSTTNGTLNIGNYSGFAAQGGNLTVNTGATNPLVWSTNFVSAGTNLLAFGSTTANGQVELQNGFTLGNNGTGAGTARTISVQSGVGGDSTLLSGIITDALITTTAGATFNGNEALIKTGNGSLVLTGANNTAGTAATTPGNTYGGTTTINAGTLVAGANSTTRSPIAVTINTAFTAGTNTVTLNSVTGLAVGQVLSSNGLTIGLQEGTYITAIDTTTNTVTLSQNTVGTGGAAGGTLTAGTPGVFGVSNSAVSLSAVTNSSPSLQIGGAFTISSPVTVANVVTTGAYSIGGNTASAATFSGLVTANQSLNVNQATGGMLNITGGINGPSAAPTAGTITTLGFNNAGAVNVTTNGITNGLGTVALTKGNVGLLTLTAANGYTGATTVSGGTLLVNGSLAGGSVVTVNGGVLGGTGTIGGATTLSVGGSITGGTVGAVGALTLSSSLTLSGGSIYQLDVGAGAGMSDVLAIGGTLLSNGATIRLNSGVLDGTSTYTIATYASDAGSSFVLANVPSTYTVFDTGTMLELVPVTPVPEPSTWAAGVLCLLVGIGYIKRKRAAILCIL